VRNSPPRTELDSLLLAIPAATYVRELAGLEPRGDGKVNCPFHHDERPSLQLYDDGTWCCFGQHGGESRIGGSVYDFGSRLWGLEAKGREFLELRQRLAETLLPLRLGSSHRSDFRP
jgi:DNA primase